MKQKKHCAVIEEWTILSPNGYSDWIPIRFAICPNDDTSILCTKNDRCDLHYRHISQNGSRGTKTEGRIGTRKTYKITYCLVEPTTSRQVEKLRQNIRDGRKKRRNNHQFRKNIGGRTGTGERKKRNAMSE